MVRIPIYLYDDYPWLPYAGTPAGCDNIGFVVKGISRAEVDEVIEKISDVLFGYEDCNGKERNAVYGAC